MTLPYDSVRPHLDGEDAKSAPRLSGEAWYQ